MPSDAGRRAQFIALGLLGCIAFINAMGAVIVFPLAPFMARDLGVPAHEAALTSTTFTLAAAVGGLVGAIFLGGYSRRVSLVTSLAGLGIGTLGGAVAPNFESLLLMRALAGFCSGPLMATLTATAAESVAESQRNRAISVIIGTYGLALVMGLPFALLLTEWGGWRLPFLAMAGLCLAALIPAWPVFAPRPGAPPLGRVGVASLLRQLRRGESLTGLGLIAAASFASLLLSPHISAYALHNLGISESGLRVVYLIGGGLGLLTTRITGTVMDRVSPFQASVGVAVVMTLVLAPAFWLSHGVTMAIVMLGLVLAVQLARSTVAQASASRVPEPADRISYQCLAAASTSLFQAVGGAFSAAALREAPSGRLVGVEWLAGLSILLAWLAPVLVALLDRQLARRRAA
ncbi:MFS transporter [Acetobacteraceae bacterium H6797]|nr:MFS transporter [Acetobacteraceae bacterium H6797]